MTVTLLACTGEGNSDADGLQAMPATDDDPPAVEALLQQSMQSVEPIKYYEYVDRNNGLVQARYPIPRSWKVNAEQDPVHMQGPADLKVYKTETQRLAWSTDPMMRQTIRMSGQTLQPPLSIREVLEQSVIPSARARGHRFLTSYPLDEVTGFWQRFLNAMPDTGSQRQVDALGAEFTNGSGARSLTVVVRSQFTSGQAVTWTLQTTVLESASDYFDEAKSAYLYALANAQINPQWIQRMNGQLLGDIRQEQQYWANAAAHSAAAHRQRMNAIAARGDAATAVGDTYSGILDISHRGYLDRSNIADAGHAQTVRAIGEAALIGNHETGEHYRVPAGSRFYWVSNDGLYIGTDNALFDPNISRQTNDKDWTKFAVER